MFKCKYFGIKELVSNLVYAKFGEMSWQFLDKDVLEDIDTIRATFGSEIIINNWAVGGQYKESGLRSNMDSILKNKKALYLSAHVLGCGYDLKAKNGKNKELHALVCKLVKEKKLKKIRRVENFVSTPTWVHVDGFQTVGDILVIF